MNYKDKIFEITTYRKDIAYTGIRTPNIIYTPHLEDDILRRDFTINTICMDENGEIIEQGNHEELIKQGGFYHSLYHSQFN